MVESHDTDPEHLIHHAAVSPTLGSANWAEIQPFNIGTLKLASTGELCLDHEASFFKAAHVATTQNPVAPSLPLHSTTPNLPHEASHLPFPLTIETHQDLLDRSFAYSISFLMAPFQDYFETAMHANCQQPSLYYSPSLHLICLGLGSRHITDEAVWNNCAASNYLFDMRGQDFIDQARLYLEMEMHSPTLSTIIAMLLLTIYLLGTKQE